MKFSTPQPLYCEGGRLQPIYVYQAPVRIWHWLHAFSFLVLAVTGILIAHPLPSPLGEASAHMAFGRVISLMGGSAGARSWHLFGMWMMVVFAIIHVYMAVRCDAISHQSSVSTMIGGWRMFHCDYENASSRL